MAVREILLATGNADKAREMEEILSLVEGGSPLVRWRRLSEFSGIEAPEEDGPSLLSNAEIKARYYALRTGLWTIADDSGLEVDALDGEPGVRSARFAGPNAGYADNNALLIARLAGVPADRRSARFRCAVVLSDGRRVLAGTEGVVEGRIIDEPRGRHGFGYDPYFLVPAFGQTTAEMEPARKHAISHRGRALRQLRAMLPAVLAGAQGDAEVPC